MNGTTQRMYVGEIEALIGKTALVRPSDTDKELVLAQFDDTELIYNGVWLGFGWHAFHLCNFADLPEAQ